MKTIGKFFKDTSGATAIEYGLIAALIAAALVSGATVLGNSLNSNFEGMSDSLDTAADSTPVIEQGGD